MLAGQSRWLWLAESLPSFVTALLQQGSFLTLILCRWTLGQVHHLIVISLNHVPVSAFLTERDTAGHYLVDLSYQSVFLTTYIDARSSHQSWVTLKLQRFLISHDDMLGII